MTQTKLSELSGVSQSLISQLENSETATGSEYTPRLARALGVHVDWLADEMGEMRPEIRQVTEPDIIAAIDLLRQLPAPYRAQNIKQLDSLKELAEQIGDNGTQG